MKIVDVKVVIDSDKLIRKLVIEKIGDLEQQIINNTEMINELAAQNGNLILEQRRLYKKLEEMEAE